LISRAGIAARAVEPRVLLACCAAIAAAIALSLVVSSSAFATTGYAFADQFGAAGNDAGQFGPGGPAGIAIQQSTGDVFVSDPGHTLGDGTTPDPRVERFDASGAFQSAFSIEPGYSSPAALAVDPAGFGSLYVSVIDTATGGGAVLKYSTAGVFAYALNVGASETTINGGTAVAVDPTLGTVYATASGPLGLVVDSFDGSTGAFIGSFDGSSVPNEGPGFACPPSLAVDGASNLYVNDPCWGTVNRFSAGVFSAVVDNGSRGGAFNVATDPVSNEVFAAENGIAGPQVTAFTATGADVGQSFGAGQIAGLAGLAVNSSTSAVYVADNANSVVQRFTTFEGPTVTTTTSSSIDPHSQTINGTIDPGGVESTYHFQYGPDTNYGSQTVPESDPVTGTGELPATGTATGLNPNTTYHFRIVGTNASGSITGTDQTFTTAPAPPILDGSPAFVSSMTPTGATLNATLNPNGSTTTYHFEFGTAGPCDANPCTSTADADAGAGVGDQPVTADLTGLLTGSTTYHYRLVADNGTGGVQGGADGTFSTAPATPVSASDVSVYGADFNGVVNPHGAATTYRFEYGATTDYGRTTPETDAGSDDGEEDVTQPTGRLIPGTTYHVRLVATTNGQTTTSDDATFTTGELPVAAVSYPTGISTSEATLGGEVDTNGVDGTYTFHVESLSSQYSTTTAALPSPPGDGLQPVTAALSGLPAGETFRAVLSVTSNQATMSDEVIFATAPLAQPPKRPADSGDCINPKLDPYHCGPVPTPIAPSNKFTIAKTKINGRTATVTLKLPGAGKIRTTGGRTKAKTTRIKKAGKATIKVRLTNKAAATLADTGRVKTAIRVRFTPAGGRPNTKTIRLTFTRKVGR